MERVSLRRRYGRRIFKGALFATTALVLPAIAPRAALAQIAATTTPQGGVVVGGSASIAQAPGSTTINQSTERGAINWQSFDVGSAAKVQFNQPDAAAVTLNRVTGGNISQINGQINANGQIVLINQSGVVFGRSAQVNAESVVVSTSDIATSDFMAGRMNFSGAPNPGAKIVNNGLITARNAGLVGLVAPQVLNNGVITAELGQVVLAGASAFTLDLYGDRLISLDVTQAVRAVDVGGKLVPALVTNNGLIIADGGKVTLTAQDADALVTQLINAGGTIRADTVGSQTGTISVTGVGGNIEIAGNLLARGTATGTGGGMIEALTDGTVAVASTANIDASGPAGGGDVAIGTNLARAEAGPTDTSAPMAAVVSIAPGALIRADANDIGNAGTVTLLSQDYTNFLGTISVQGGPSGGNGGLAEISSDGVISLGGTVLAMAVDGRPGEILLDPQTLVVTLGGNAGSVRSGTTVTFGSFSGSGTSDVSPNELNSLIGTVLLEASQLVSVASAIDMTNASALSLVSGGDISITAGIFVKGDLDLEAAGSLLVAAGLQASNILLSSGSQGTDIDAGVTTGVGDTLTMASAGTIFEGTAGSINATSLISAGTIGGDVTLANGNTIATLGAFTLGGNLTLADIGGLTIGGSVSGNNISLSGASLTFESGLNAAGLLALSSNGTISQGAGAITAGTLAGSAADDFDLARSGNAITALGPITASEFDLADTGSLAVIGSVGATNVTIAVPTLSLGADITGDTLALAANDILVTAGSFTAQGADGLIEIAPFSGPTLIDFGNVSSNGTLGLPAAVTGALGANTILFGSAPVGTQATAIDIDGTENFAGATIDLSPSGGIFDNSGTLTAELLQIAATGFTQAAGAALDLTDLEGGSGAIAGNVLLKGGTNEIGTISHLLLLGTLAVTDTGEGAPLTLAGSISAGSATLNADGLEFDGFFSAASLLQLKSSADIGEGPFGTIVAGTLASASTLGGNLLLDNQSNAITALGSLAAADTISIFDSGLLTIAGSLAATAITLDSFLPSVGSAGLAFDANVNATYLELGSPGSITQSAGSITAGTLASTGTIGGGVFLTEAANDIGTLGNFNSDGSFTLDDSALLEVAGTVAAAGIGITDTVALDVEGTLLATADNIDLLTPLFSLGGAGLIAVPSGQEIGLAANTIQIASGGSFAAPAGTIALAPYSFTTIALGVPALIGGLALPNSLLQLLGADASELILGDAAGRQANVLDIDGSVSLGSSTLVDLAPADGIFDKAGTLTAGTLEIDPAPFTQSSGAIVDVTVLEGDAAGGTIDGNVLFEGGANIIGTLENFLLTGTIAVNATGDTSPLTVAGTIQAGSVTLSAPGLLFDGFLDVASLLDITSTDGASELTTGTIDAGALAGTVTGGDVSLAAAANDITTLDNFSVSDNFFLTDTLAPALTIAGAVSVTGEAAFSVTSYLETGDGALASATLDNLGALSGFTLAGTNAIGTLLGDFTFASGDFVLFDTLALALATTISAADVTFGGDGVTEISGGAIDAAILAGLGTIGGNVLLTNLNDITSVTGLTLASGDTFYLDDSADTLSIGDVTADDATFTGATSIDIDGFLDAATALVLDSAGAISETGKITTADFSGSAGGDVDLSGTNKIGTLAGFFATGGFTLDDSKALLIAGALTAASVGINDSLALDIAALVTATSGGIGLAAPGITLDNGGTLAVSAGQLIGVAADSFVIASAGALIDAPEGTFAIAGFNFTTIDIGGADIGDLDLSASQFQGPAFSFGTGGEILIGDAAGHTASAVIIDGSDNFSFASLLSLVAAGEITDIGTLAATTLAFTAAGFTQATGGELDVTLLETGGAITGPVILASTLNQVATLGTVDSDAEFALTDGIGLTVTGPVQATDLILVAPTLDLAGDITASSTLALGSTGSITQSAGTITTPLLISEGSIGGDAFLGQSGVDSITGLGNFTLGGELYLDDSTSLDVTGLVQATNPIGPDYGDVYLISDAGLTAGGTIIAPVVNLYGATSLNLAGVIDASFGLGVGSAGDVTQTGGSIVAGLLASESADGSTGTIGGDAIIDLAANTIGTLFNFYAAGDIDLADTGSLAILGAVAGADVSLSVPTLSLDSTVDATATGGTLALVTNDISITSGSFGANDGTIEIAPSASGYGIDIAGNAADALDLVGDLGGGAFNAAELILGAALGSHASFIDIDGSVSFGATGLIDLATTGGIFDNAGTLAATLLEFDAASFAQSIAAALAVDTLQGDGGAITGNVDLAGSANAIGTLGDLSLSAGSLTLIDSALLYVLGTVTASDIYLTDSGAGIDFAGALKATHTIGLVSDALSSAASGATISAPLVVISPYSASVIDFGGTGFGGLELSPQFIALIGGQELQIGTGAGAIDQEGSFGVAADTLFLDGASINIFGSLYEAGLLTFASAGDVFETATGTLDVGSLAGQADGTIGLVGANAITLLGDILAGGDITLNNAIELVIAGLVSTANSISLEGFGVTETTGGTLEAAVLDTGGTTLGGNALLANGNLIGTLTNFFVTTGSTLVFADAQLLTIGNVGAEFTTLSATGLDFEGDFNGKLLALSAGSDGILQGAGTIGVATLSSAGSIAGNVALTGQNAIETLSNFYLKSGFTLDVVNAQAMTLAGTVMADDIILDATLLDFQGDVNASDLALAGGGATQGAGTIAANTLSSDGQITGDVDLTGQNQITNLANFSLASGDTLALTDADALTLSGTVIAPTAQLTADGMTFTGSFDAGDLLLLASSGNVTQTSGVITAGTLATAGELGGSLTLLDANLFGTLGAIGAAGNIAIGNAQFLDIAGLISTAGTITLENTAGITELAGGTLEAAVFNTGSSGVAGNLLLANGNLITDLGNVSLKSGATLDLADAQALTIAGTIIAGYDTFAATSLDITGDIDPIILALAITGPITETGAIDAGTLYSEGAIGGDVALTSNFNTIGTLGFFSVASGFSLDIDDNGLLVLAGPVTADFATFSAGSLDFAGDVTSADLLALASAAGIDQTAGTITAGTLISQGPSIGGNVFLTLANNAITDLGNFVLGAGDTLALTDATALTLAGAIFAPFATFSATSLAITGALDDTELALIAVGGVSETGTVTAATLTSGGATDGNVYLTASNTIASVAGFTVGSGDTFVIDDTGLLTVTGPLHGTYLTLSSATIAIPGSITADQLALESSGTVFEDGGAIFTTLLTSGGTTLGGDATLLGPNLIGTLGDFALDGNFALSDSSALIIAGILATPAGDVTLEDATAGITETSGLIISKTLDTGGTTIGGDLLLDAANTIGNLGAITLAAGDTFTLLDTGLLNIAGTVFAPVATISAGSLAIAGALDGTYLALAAQGTIDETTGTIAVSTLASDGTIGGDAFLTQANYIGTLENFTMAPATTLSLTDLEILALAGTIIAPNAIFNAPGLAFDGVFNAGQILALTGETLVTEGPGGAITAGTLTSGGSLDGSILLTGNANTISTIAAFNVSTIFALDDTGLLTVEGPLTGPTITLSSPTITIPGIIDATLLALESTGNIFEPGGTITATTLTSGGTTIGGGLTLLATNTIGTLGNIFLDGDFALANTGDLVIAGSLVTPGGIVTLEDNASIFESAGFIDAATLTSGGTTIGGDASFNGAANLIANLGDFTLAAGHTLIMDDKGLLTVLGTVFAPFATLTTNTLAIAGALDGTQLALAGIGTVSETGTIDVGTLTSGGLSDGTVTLLKGNIIGTLGAFTATGDIALFDITNLDIAGLVTTAASISLEGNSDITEIAGGTLAAAELDSGGTTIAGAVSLANTNQIAALGGFAASGNITFVDGESYVIDGAVVSGNTVFLGGKGVRETGAGLIDAGALASDGTISGSATLNGANTIKTLRNFDATGSLYLTDDEDIDLTGAIALGGTFGILDTGNVTQSAGGVTAAALTSDGGVIGAGATLNGANDIGTLGDFAATDGLALDDLEELDIAGIVDLGGTLAIADVSNVAQTAGAITAAALTSDGGSIGGDALFNEPDNQIAAIGDLTALGGLSVVDDEALNIAGNLDTGDSPIDLNTGGFAITQTAGVISGGTFNATAGGIRIDGANTIAALGAVTTGALYAAGIAAITGPVNASTATIAGGLLISGNLDIAGNLLLSGANIDQTAGQIISDNEFLTATAGIDLAGIDLAAGTISALAHGEIAQTAGTLAAAAISEFSYGTSVTQSAGAVMTAGDINLTSGQFGGVYVSGILNAGNIGLGGDYVDDQAQLLAADNANIFARYGVVLDGNNVVTGQLTARGYIIQQQSGSIQAGNLLLYGDDAGIILHGNVAAQTATLHDYGSGSGFGAYSGLQLGGNISVAGALDLISGSGIYETGGTVRAGNITAVSDTLPTNNIVLDGALYDAGSLNLTAAANITQNGSPLTAGPANMSAGGGITLGGLDSFAGLATDSAQFDQSGGVISTPEADITATGNIIQNAGSLIATKATLKAGDEIVLNGAADIAGDFDLIAGGDILHDTGDGLLAAGTLTGSGGQLADFTAPTDFGTIGSFVLQDSAFLLDNLGTLNIIGPLVANVVSITAVGQIDLTGSPNGGLFITGINEPAKLTTPQPEDSVITVTQAPGGPEPLILQTGTFYLNAGPEAAIFQAFANQPATLFLDATPDGNIEFQPGPPTDTGLFGPTVTVKFSLGDAGIASGNVDLLSVVVISGTATDMTGILDGVSGTAAAGKGTADPFPKPPYQFNACPLGSVNCIILPIETLPTNNPLQNIDIVQKKRKRLNNNVELPGVATRDF
jgi:filamentous hemagglutinin family protein